MSTNRISEYFDEPEKAVEKAPRPAEAPRAPSGFVPVPPSMLPPDLSAGDVGQLYRAAYEQAVHDARQRLIDLLRSRMAG
jgi:hypothetical protein